MKQPRRLPKIVTAEFRPIRPQRKFNRVCRLLCKLAIATSLFIILIALIYGYIKFQEYMTPKEYISPATNVKVSSPDIEAILKSKVSEIWNGEKFIPSYDFKLVKQAEAKTEPVEETHLTGSIEDKIRAKFGDYANIALAIAKCESGFNEKAIGDKNLNPSSYGVFQVRAFSTRPSIEKLLTADANIDWAYKMSGGGVNWNPWSTFKNGCYRKWL